MLRHKQPFLADERSIDALVEMIGWAGLWSGQGGAMEWTGWGYGVASRALADQSMTILRISNDRPPCPQNTPTVDVNSIEEMFHTELLDRTFLHGACLKLIWYAWFSAEQSKTNKTRSSSYDTV